MSDNSFGEVAQHMRGLQIAQMIHIAAKLSLADRVGEGRPVAEIAAEADAHPEKLGRMVRALSTFGIFAIDEQGKVTHTAGSDVLRSDAKPTLHYAALYWCSPRMWETWGSMEHTIRTGEAAFVKAFGQANFEYLKDHPDDAAVFDAFMRHSPDDRHGAVAEAYDFSGMKVVDVGGGNGALLAAILRRYPSTSGVLADQEDVVSAASAVLGDLVDRCEIVPVDFFSAIPAGGDIYTMAQILHDWSDEQAGLILATTRLAMRRDSGLVVIERLLDDDPAKNSKASVLADMQMMAVFPGAKERTLAEFTALLTKGGFSAPKVIATQSPFVLLETRAV